MSHLFQRLQKQAAEIGAVLEQRSCGRYALKHVWSAVLLDDLRAVAQHLHYLESRAALARAQEDARRATIH